MLALQNIETYIMNWKATTIGLMKEILINCMDVLTGCKLLEIWCVSKNNTQKDVSIKNIAHIFPIESRPPVGKHLIVQSVTLKHEVLGKDWDYVLLHHQYLIDAARNYAMANDR